MPKKTTPIKTTKPATKKKANNKVVPPKKYTQIPKHVGDAKLTLPSGEEIILPMYRGALGPDVINIAPLKKVDLFTYDPGFIATAACSSTITFIDGDKGELLYRGYPIESLTGKLDYMSVCYLLYYGELPTATQHKNYSNLITKHTMVYERVGKFINGFDSTSHPMAIMISVVGALAAFYHDWVNVKDSASRERSAVRLVAKVPTIAAMSYKYSIGHPFMYPRNKYNFVENFLYMMFATPCEAYKPDPVVVDALDAIFTLHADHEQNASTSAVRLTGSTNADPFVCVASGISALWGPAHGGANEAVLKMLEQIGTVDNIPAYIEKVKSGEGPRLMGFGHRVYKSFDPRASVMHKICHKILKHLKLQDNQLFKIALELEKIALSDEYFVKRKLYPNVDFYSGIVLRAIGIPTSMFTAIFAIGRTIGWVSQWNELHEDAEFRIGRPRQMYLGYKKRSIKKSK